MKNLTNDNDWLWDKNKFINRKYIMQEMYQNYTDGDDWEVEKVYFFCRELFLVKIQRFF